MQIACQNARAARRSIRVTIVVVLGLLVGHIRANFGARRDAPNSPNSLGPKIIEKGRQGGAEGVAGTPPPSPQTPKSV